MFAVLQSNERFAQKPLLTATGVTLGVQGTRPPLSVVGIDPHFQRPPNPKFLFATLQIFCGFTQEPNIN